MTVREIGTSDDKQERSFTSGPIYSIFQVNGLPQPEILEGRLRELSYLNRRISITLTRPART
jgi:DNA gyrase/topoisomerase IV subunit B